MFEETRIEHKEIRDEGKYKQINNGTQAVTAQSEKIQESRPELKIV